MRAAQTLENLLDEIGTAGPRNDSVSMDDIRTRLGRRSFGALLLVGGLPCMTPVVTVPGLSSVFALIALLTAAQLLLGLDHVWLPPRLRRATLRREKVERMVRFVRPAARFVDRFSRPRLHMLIVDPAMRIVALTCVVLALTIPPLEFVPLTTGFPAAPIALFGFALITRDGALVVAGYAVLAVEVAGAIGAWTLFR